MIPVAKLVIVCLVVGFYKLVLSIECDIKTICERKENITSNITLQECQDKHFSVSGRCCYLNNLIVGIDLNGCDVSSVAGKLTQYPDLVVLGLEDNPHFNCTDENEYKSLKKLDFLVLPSHCPNCPGSWNNTRVIENCTVCDGIIDECIQLNLTCPEYAKCVSNGPGIASCECIPGHYGYKCLREGTFPMVPFSVGILVPTLVVSFFVWFTQRRLVKKNN